MNIAFRSIASLLLAVSAGNAQQTPTTAASPTAVPVAMTLTTGSPMAAPVTSIVPPPVVATTGPTVTAKPSLKLLDDDDDDSVTETGRNLVIDANTWIVPASGQGPVQDPVMANVGDTIIFEWNGGHNAVIHPSGSCQRDQNDVAVAEVSGESYTLTDADGGKILFIASDVSNDCDKGVYVEVQVASANGSGGGSGMSTPSGAAAGAAGGWSVLMIMSIIFALI